MKKQTAEQVAATEFAQRRLLRELNAAIAACDHAILATPSGPVRNELTVVQIRLAQAMESFQASQSPA